MGVKKSKSTIRIFVKVKWGESLDINQCTVEEYEFKTKGEVEAFLLGVNEGNGWFDYKVKIKTCILDKTKADLHYDSPEKW
jgi:hypothetical protein